VCAVVGKIVGATLSARFLKNSWRESFTIGILMNTKGLVELIVLNVGLDVGVLNTEVKKSNGHILKYRSLRCL
jgi:Kef-type K+ transport system membrane component KefB